GRPDGASEPVSTCEPCRGALADPAAAVYPPVPFLFLLTPRPPTSTLFPYTTLFRSNECYEASAEAERAGSGEARPVRGAASNGRSEEHTSELQSLRHLVCRLLLEKKKKITATLHAPTLNPPDDRIMRSDANTVPPH